jgi:carboxymethylenebutenolidase
VHDVKEYPNAGHSFLNTALSGPAIMRPLVRVMNLGPEPESAKDAWSRIDAFFGEHLERQL